MVKSSVWLQSVGMAKTAVGGDLNHWHPLGTALHGSGDTRAVSCFSTHSWVNLNYAVGR
jgi:hypothetical protein